MKLNCKPGDLAVVVRSDFPQNLGKYVTVVCLANQEDYDMPLDSGDWDCQPRSAMWGWDNAEKTQASIGDDVMGINDAELRPIRDQPGNEQFVVEARKSLPRSKPATAKGDTIDARGEVHS